MDPTLEMLRAAVIGSQQQPQAAPAQNKQPVPFSRQMPDNGRQAAQQMSLNAGRNLMPGGEVGAVRLAPYGSDKRPQMGFNPFNYGMSPNYGEATFFQEAIGGGVAPISAVKPLGVPKNWNPKPGKGNGPKGGGPKDNGPKGNGPKGNGPKTGGNVDDHAGPAGGGNNNARRGPVTTQPTMTASMQQPQQMPMPAMPPRMQQPLVIRNTPLVQPKRLFPF